MKEKYKDTIRFGADVVAMLLLVAAVLEMNRIVPEAKEIKEAQGGMNTAAYIQTLVSQANTIAIICLFAVALTILAMVLIMTFKEDLHPGAVIGIGLSIAMAGMIVLAITTNSYSSQIQGLRSTIDYTYYLAGEEIDENKINLDRYDIDYNDTEQIAILSERPNNRIIPIIFVH